MSVEDELTRLVGVDALAKGLQGASAELREWLSGQLKVTERRPVELDLDGRPVTVATVSYSKGRKGTTAAAVVDPAAFAEWVATEHPEAIVQRPADWFTAETLKVAQQRGVAVDVNGEPIPGVEVTERPDGQPYIVVKHETTIEAKAALMSALLDNNAAGVRSLLALTPTTERENNK